MSEISIVVPIYNAEKYLSNCIKSILDQSFKDFELILVNDGSTDKSFNICNKFSENDKRIIVINKKNEGTIKTRRIGIEKASSKYITFVDSDDWIDKCTLEVVNSDIKENNPDVIMFNMYKVIGKLPFIKKKNNTLYFDKKKSYIDDEIRTELTTAFFHGHPLSSGLCGKAYKKEFLINSGKYLDNIKFLGDDLFYNLEIFLKIHKIDMINKPLYYYRVGGNTSKFMPYLFDDMISGYNIQKNIIEKYYQDSRQIRLNGISIMLLNTFKTCLYNINLSNLSRKEIEKNIFKYIKNEYLLEATKNEGVLKYFDEKYLSAINESDSEYLYRLGRYMYEKIKIKRNIMKYLN